ncbi:hypothetical protein K438DRAFT_1779293 [Mycena galopus ATCC 62051]|nr:hypothetical protein K438DRAFT_1779293 [Mycena galopus ATCC 62051]
MPELVHMTVRSKVTIHWGLRSQCLAYILYKLYLEYSALSGYITNISNGLERVFLALINCLQIKLGSTAGTFTSYNCEQMRNQSMDEVAHQSKAEDHEIKHLIRAQGSPKVHLALPIVLCDILDAVKNPKKRGCVVFFQYFTWFYLREQLYNKSNHPGTSHGTASAIMPGLITSLVSKRGAPAFHRILPGSTQCVVTREGLEIPGLRSYGIFSQKRGKSVMVDSHEETQRMIVHFNRAEIPELYMLLDFSAAEMRIDSPRPFPDRGRCGDVWLCFGYPSANHLAADRGELGPRPTSRFRGGGAAANQALNAVIWE